MPVTATFMHSDWAVASGAARSPLSLWERVRVRAPYT
jgi:hypothetical protein